MLKRSVCKFWGGSRRASVYPAAIPVRSAAAAAQNRRFCAGCSVVGIDSAAVSPADDDFTESGAMAGFNTVAINR